MITSDANHPLAYQVPFRCAKANLAELADGPQAAVARGLGDHGALLWGPTGVGKTYALCAALNSLGASESLWVDWPEFVRDIKRFESLRSADRERFDPLERLCAWRGALFVDDIGQEQSVIAGYRVGEAESIFDEFVNRRHGFDQSLWIATNLSPRGLAERYGERSVSRLAEHCVIYAMDGADRRLSA